MIDHVSPYQQSRNTRTGAKVGFVALFMLGLAFAAVPLYDLYCRVTGYGGTTQVANSAPDTVRDQTIVVRFDANTAAGMAWDFRPVAVSQEVKIGENGLAFYRAYNPTNRTITGTASFNVAPSILGPYFTKIDCFCFTEQKLRPGESIDMPVSYFIDPEILNDLEARDTQVVTLSYTFFETEGSAREGAGNG